MSRRTLHLIVLVSLSLSIAGAQENIVPFQGLTPQEPQGVSTSCGFPGVKLPPKTVVFAAGAYGGRDLNRQIDQSGHEAMQIDVTVNSPRPVALVLGAYEPMIWNVGWTKGTEIVAVLVSGYHRQVVAGLPKATPLLISTHHNNGACGFFYLSQEEMPKINEISRKVFGSAVDTAFFAQDGSVLVGSPLEGDSPVLTSDWKTVESFFIPGAPLAGKLGLDEAVAKGLIRLATEGDFEMLRQAVEAEKERKDGGSEQQTKLVGSRKPGRSLIRRGINGTYVVLKKFTYPAGLYGGNSASFIVLKGVPSPDGKPGHSDVFDLNKTPICQGPACRSRD